MKWLVVGTLAVAVSVHHMDRAYSKTLLPSKPAAEQHDVQKLADLVHATPEQVQQIQALHAKLGKAMSELKADSKLTESERSQRMEDLHREAMVAFHKILTPSQIQLLAQNGFAMLAAHLQHGLPAEVVRKLNLTDAQSGEIEQIVGDIHRKIDEIKGETSLTPDQLKQRLEEVHKEAMTKLHEVLTPDQAMQLHKMMMEMLLG